MQEVFEKIIEKLEEKRRRYFLTIANTGDEKLDCAYEYVGDALDKAIEIVKQEAEKYNNGWIPCSEQLPENSNNILICLSDGYVNVGYYSSKEFRDMNSYLYKDVIAWQPLPEPYKET